MWKKLLVVQVLFACLQLFANPYERCKDILREGIHDTISSQTLTNHALLVRQEFCSIAKESALNENNYEAFARDYIRKTKASHNSYGANAQVGWRLLSIASAYQQSDINENASDNEKMNFLKQYQMSILEYYMQHCGNESLEESLRIEAVMNSRIANPSVVKAWRDCMTKRVSGFWVELIPSSTDMNADSLEYSALVHWESKENTEIVSIALTFRPEVMEVSASILKTQGSYAKIDICEDKNCTLKSGCTLSLNILHKNRNESLNIAFEGKNEKGMMNAHIVTLPKKIVPPKIDLQNHAYWAIESFCDQMNCLEYMRNISCEKHQIGKDFVASSAQLEPGTCKHCSKNKNLRFTFKNCSYKTRYQVKSQQIIEPAAETALDIPKYFYFFGEGKEYVRIRIITTKIT